MTLYGTMPLVLGLLAGCSPVTPIELGDAFVLRVGETVRVRSVDTELTLASIDADSRCPPTAQCVWAGEVTLTLDVNGADTVMSTEQSPTTVAPGFALSLVDVTPGPPDLPGDLRAQSAYEASFETRTE